MIKPEGAILLNAKMPPYQPVNAPTGYDPTRTRHLLLHKKELDYLMGKSKEGGLTIIPLSLYTKGRRIKVSIGLARHKKKRDKRENIKKREAKREIDRTLKSNN
ncbi:MAG: SsrA-binding protein [Parcubacteria group bacterium Athens0714_26]|nr:MAG: SsrA-binding protein [Parcubacteria group bacterium Athens0714_26]